MRNTKNKKSLTLHRTGAFTQILIQVIFAVRFRENLLQKCWRQEVFKYMSGTIRDLNQKALIVNGHTDHVHCLFGMRPSARLSDLVREIKTNSTKFINEKGFVKGHFSWQEGYGAFSYSHSHLDRVYKYILNQENYHDEKIFRAEYMEHLITHEIEHDERFLFEWIE